VTTAGRAAGAIRGGPRSTFRPRHSINPAQRSIRRGIAFYLRCAECYLWQIAFYLPPVAFYPARIAFYLRRIAFSLPRIVFYLRRRRVLSAADSALSARRQRSYLPQIPVLSAVRRALSSADRRLGDIPHPL